MSEKLLEISGLSVCYEGEQILNNICFSVEKGETVGIAGESGSGSSARPKWPDTRMFSARRCSNWPVPTSGSWG